MPFSLCPFSPSILLSSSSPFYLTSFILLHSTCSKLKSSLVLVLFSSHKQTEPPSLTCVQSTFLWMKWAGWSKELLYNMLMSLYISHMYCALINIPRPRNHKYNGLETHYQDHNGLDLEREGRSGSLVKTNIPHFCNHQTAFTWLL